MKRNKSSQLSKKDFRFLYALLIVSLVIFIILLASINSKCLSGIDKKVNLSMQNIQYPILISISKIITNIFEPTFFILLSLIIVVYLIYKRRNSEALFLSIILIIAKVVVDIIKIVYARARPENIIVSESTFSFPSSHALMAAIFFGTLVFLFKHHMHSKKSKLIAISLAVLAILIMGLTRLVLNARWFSDVVTGFSLGIFLLVSYILLTAKERFL